jgi:hypothetical protein
MVPRTHGLTDATGPTDGRPIGVALIGVNMPFLVAPYHVTPITWDGSRRACFCTDGTLVAEVLKTKVYRLIRNQWQIRGDAPGSPVIAKFLCGRVPTTRVLADATIHKQGGNQIGSIQSGAWSPRVLMKSVMANDRKEA